MKLIIGLGNPGKKYERTRHNVGFLTLDALHIELQKQQISAWSISTKFNAMIAGCVVHNEKIILAKPMTFMNESGQAVRLIAEYYHLTSRDLIVIHDEKDLPLGEIKIQTNRSDAGHNGIKSIVANVGTQDFTRVRIGIASENKDRMKDTADFVLGKFGLLEKRKLEKVISEVVEKIIKLLTDNG